MFLPLTETIEYFEHISGMDILKNICATNKILNIHLAYFFNAVTNMFHRTPYIYFRCLALISTIKNKLLCKHFLKRRIL